MVDLTQLVTSLAQQAIGGNNQNNQSSSGLGGLVGSVLGQLGQSNSGQSNGLGGILGSVVGSVMGGGSNAAADANGSSSSGSSKLLLAVVPLILAWVQQNGGIQGALSKLQGLGLGSQVSNWVSTESNSEHISSDTVQNLFSSQEVQNVAEQTQSSPNEIYGAISSVLPQVVNALTPNGEESDHKQANSEIENVLGMVSGFLK